MSDTPTPNPLPQYLTRKEAAQMLRLSPSGLDQAVKRGTLPPPVHISTRQVLYNPLHYTSEALEAWVTAHPRPPAKPRPGRPPRRPKEDLSQTGEVQEAPAGAAEADQ